MYARRLLFGFITVVLVLSCVTFFTSFESVCDRPQQVKHSTTIRNQTNLIYVRDESLCNCDYNYTDVEYQCDSLRNSLITSQNNNSFAWGTTLSSFDPNYQPPLIDLEFLYSQVPVKKSDVQKSHSICIVTSEFPQTGTLYGDTGTAFYELARLLLRDGHKVRILFLGDGLNWHRKSFLVDKKEIVIDTLESPSVHILPDAHVRKQSQVLNYFLNHEGEYDVVHFHEWHGYGHFTMLAKMQGWAFNSTSFVVHVHRPEIWSLLMNQKYPNLYQLELNYYEKTMTELADVVISPSGYMLHYLRNNDWKLPKRSYVIQNLYPPESLPTTSDDQTPIKELVYFGKLDNRKPSLVFLKAVENLGTEFNTEHEISITFINSQYLPISDSIKSTINEAIAQSPILKSLSVTFIDVKDPEDAITYLSKPTRLVVLSNLMDNSPYTVYLCLLNKIKFIASNVGGIPELIHPEDRDILFAPHFKYLAQKLRSVITEEFDISARLAISQDRTRKVWKDFHSWVATSKNDKKHQLIDQEIEDNPPLVSLCITHHERPDLLKITLQGLVLQTYKNYQIGIVDDGSSNETVHRMKTEIEPWLRQNFPGKFQIWYQPNSYLGAARNFCADKFKNTKYISFLDDDDVCQPHYLSRLVKTAEFTNYDAISTQFHVFTAAPKANPLVDNLDSHSIWAFTGGDLVLSLFNNVLGGANIFMKRAVFDELKGFTTYQRVGFEDYEFLVRLKLQGLLHTVIPEAIIYIRNTRNSMMKRDDPFTGELRTMTAYMDNPYFKPIRDLFLTAKGLWKESSQHVPRQQATASIVKNVVTDSKLDFSNIQGKRGWYYGFRRSAKSDELNITTVVYKDNRWITNSNVLDWPYVDDTVNHPSIINHQILSAVRRWISWEEGKFIATLTSQRLSTISGCGDGVDIYLVVDGRVYFKRTATSSDRVQNDVNINLKVGSKVDLVVDPKKTDNCDATFVELEIWSND